MLEDVGGVEVGNVSGSSLLLGSNTHSLLKDTSSSATRPLRPCPCSYLKTICGGGPPEKADILSLFLPKIPIPTVQH